MKQCIFLKNLFGIVFLIFLTTVHSSAQKTNQPDTTGIEQPQFIGGNCALQKYMAENYPIAARRYGIDSKVIVGLVIEADGQISYAKVLEAHYYKAGFKAFSKKVKQVPQLKDQEPILYRDMNARVLQMVKAMPKWQAGKKDGVPVRMNCTLPITYQLTEGTLPILVFMPTGLGHLGLTGF